MNIIENYIGKLPYLTYLKHYDQIAGMQIASGASLFECMYRFFNGRESSYDDLTVKKQDRVCKRCGVDGWDVKYSAVAREWLCRRCNDVWVSERC